MRKHLSAIKGGRLAAAAAPAKVVSLVVSDIPGDDPALVASGPTVADASEPRRRARRSSKPTGMELPAAVMAHLAIARRPMRRCPDDPRFAGNEVRLIASAAVSLEAAAAEARRQGVAAVNPVRRDRGRGARRRHACTRAIAREVALRNRPFAKPVLILSGGETTVTLRGKGSGGRNSEFLLAFALASTACRASTRWPPTPTASTARRTMPAPLPTAPPLARMRAAGVDAGRRWPATTPGRRSTPSDDLFRPGPTGTNVNDFRAIWIRG